MHAVMGSKYFQLMMKEHGSLCDAAMKRIVSNVLMMAADSYGLFVGPRQNHMVFRQMMLSTSKVIDPMTGGPTKRPTRDLSPEVTRKKTNIKRERTC